MTHPLQPAVTRLCLLRAGCGEGLLKKEFDSDVAPAAAHRMSAAELRAAYEEARNVLLSEGLAERKPGSLKRLILTAAGEAEAARALSLPSWPKKATWSKIVRPRLVAFALGRLDEEGLAATKFAAGLRREIHRIRLGETPKKARLDLATELRIAAAVGSVQKDDRSLRKALLRRAAEKIAKGEADWPLAEEETQQPAPRAKTPPPAVAPAAVAKTTVAAPMLDLAPADAAAPASTTQLSLEDFAREVRRLAEETPTGRIGDDLVFINHVWRHVTRVHPEWGMSLNEFKARLREAAIARRITLMVSNVLDESRKPDMFESRIDDGFRRWDLVDLAAPAGR